MLQIRNLSRSFGDQCVLDDISLRIDTGEILGLVGPNGAGKSTLLRCLIGLVRPDAGSISVDGVDAIGNSLEARSLIGYGPSETAMYHRMTSLELLRFALAFHQTADLAAGRALLERFAVPLRRRVRHLSHGMKRKIILAQALASGAPMLALDEPMEALDPEARRLVERLLRERAAAGTAVLFSSHDLASTERLCDRIAFLRSGEIIREGLATELLEESARLIHFTLRQPMNLESLPTREGWRWVGGGTNWSLTHAGLTESVLVELGSVPIAGIRDGAQSLEDLFATLYPEDTD